jgi:hypothetical protein
LKRKKQHLLKNQQHLKKLQKINKMKTCKTGCGKMKAGGSVKKVKKMATGGQALNKAKGFAPAQKGGDNVSKQIYGIPNAGTTGPNRTAAYDYKKGGSVKKLKKAQNGAEVDLDAPPFKTRSSKIGVGLIGSGIAGMATKAIADKVKARKAAKKASEEKKKNETTKAKFGASIKKYPDGGSTKESKKKEPASKENNYREPSLSPSIRDSVNVYRRQMKNMRLDGGKGPIIKGKEEQYKKAASNLERQFTKTGKAKFGAEVKVQRGYPGKIRSSEAQGYTAVGKREPGRTKFPKLAKGGFPDLTGDGKVTKADVLKGRGVIKKKGGAVKKK